MYLIIEDAILPIHDSGAVHVENQQLVIDYGQAATYYVKNIPDNALQQIAVAIAENKHFLEMDGTLVK